MQGNDVTEHHNEWEIWGDPKLLMTTAWLKAKWRHIAENIALLSTLDR